MALSIGITKDIRQVFTQVNFLGAFIGNATAYMSKKIQLDWVRTSECLPDYDEYVLWRTNDYNYYVDALDKDDEIMDTSYVTHWARFKGPKDA